MKRSRSWQGMRWMGASLLGASLVLAVPAQATLSGTPPAYVTNYRLWGSAAVTGNTLMYDDGTVNFSLIPGGTDGIINELPPGAEVEAAFLFWSGTFDPVAPNFIPADRDLRFAIPAGPSFNLSVDLLEPGEDPAAATFNQCLSVEEPAYGYMQHFFMCRRDVTYHVRQGGSFLNGAYHVDGVEALAGDCSTDPLCQAKYAGWSLIVVWSAPTQRVRRDVVLFDGFYLFDEEAGPPFSSGVSPFYTLDHFEVGDTPRGSLSMFALEGDEQLGVPPQNLQGCTTCYDFFEVYTEQNAVRTKLSDDVNPPDNVFNGSRSRGGTSPGVDLDTFDVSSILRSGDTFLRFRVGSGDGVEGGELGGGELVLLGYVIVSLDTYAPNLNDTATFKSVAEDTATPGSVLHYTIRVTNQDGSAAAHNVRVRDAIPAGTSYIPGTTRACGSAVGDVGGTTPLATTQGLNIGTLYERPPGTQSCEIKFQVRVNDATAPGTDVVNRATITSDETEPFDRTAVTRIEGVRLATPTKSVLDVNGGDLVPGDVVTYTITLRNDSDAAVAGVDFDDPLPGELENTSVLVVPSGAQNQSSAGRVRVTGISIGPRSSASIVFTGQVRLDVSSGTPVVNQGFVSHSSLPTPLATDDPRTSAPDDPTIINVFFRIDLTRSSKAGVDVNGGAPEPGDLLRYTLTLINSGSISASANVQDDLPFGVTGCTLTYRPPGSTVACYPGGAQGAGQVRGDLVIPAGATRQIVVETRIATSAPAGLRIENLADLTWAEQPGALVQLRSNAFVVVASPVLTTSSKTVEDLDGAPTRPGDMLRYTITILNTGNRDATNLRVTDRVDPNLTDVAPAQGGGYDGTQIVWDSSTTPGLVRLVPGGRITLSFIARVRPGVPDRTVLRNAADLTSAEVTTPVVLRADPVLVRSAPRLVLSKTVLDLNPAPYEPGDRVRYTLTLSNTGDAAATNVVLRDPIDAALENVLPSAGGSVLGSEVVWNASTTAQLARLDVNQSVTLRIDATIRSRVDDGQVVSNQAQVSSSEVTTPVFSDDPALGGIADPTLFTISAHPSLALSKTVVDDNGGSFVPGERVTYTLAIENRGRGAALDVVLSDVFPPQLEDVQATPPPSQQVGNGLQWTSAATPALARIWPGERVEVLVSARIVRPLADGSSVSNQGAVAARGTAAVASDDPGTPAPLDPTVFFVRSIPVLSEFTKAVADDSGDGVYRPGERVTYTLRVRNSGSEDATDVVVRDTLPAQLTAIAAPGGRVSGNLVEFDRTTWPELSRLAPDQDVTLLIQATLRRPLDPATEVRNQASVQAVAVAPELSDDPATEDVDDPTRFVVTSAPDLSSLSKSVLDPSGAPVRPGDGLDYRIVVENRGDADAVAVEIRDAIDSSLTVTAIGSGGRQVGNELVWDASAVPDFARLAPDKRITLTFSARVASPLDNNTRIANQAIAQVTGLPAPVLSDDPATAALDDPTVVFVVSAADLSSSTKQALDLNGQVLTTARPGDTLLYRLTVRNNGDAVARDVVVSDSIDANLTVGAISDGGTLSGGQIRWTSTTVPALAALAPGGQATLSFNVALRSPLDNGLVIANQGSMLVEGAVNPFVTDDPATAEQGDSTRLTVVSAPDLSGLLKTYVDLNGGEVEPGDRIRYEIVLINNGDALAREVVVEDLLDAIALTAISAPQGRLDSGRVIFDASTLPGLSALGVGSSNAIRLGIDAEVVFPLADGTVVSNQATAVARDVVAVASDDPTTAASDDPTRFTVRSVPRLVLRKTLLSPPSRVAPPGGEVRYRLEVENTGTAPATQVVLVDPFAAELGFVAADQGSYDSLSRTWTLNLPTLDARSPPLSIQLDARVLDDVVDGTVVSNQARVQAQGLGDVASDDPQTPVPSDPTLFSVRAIVDLAGSTKTVVDVDGDVVRPGDLLRYTITVFNQGNTAARDVTVIDALPGLLVPDAAATGHIDGQRITWDAASDPRLARVAVGEPVDLVFTARVARDVADGTVLPNQARLGDARAPEAFVTDDPSTPAQLGDPTLVTVHAPALHLEKTVVDENGGTVRPGDVLSYRLRARNTGSVALRGLTLTDPVPEGTAVEALADGAQLQGGAVLWTPASTPRLGQIEAGATVEVGWRARVDARALGGQQIRNQASSSSDDLIDDLLSDDPGTSAPADPTVVEVDARVELSQSQKRAIDPPQPVEPGSEVRFAIEVRNSGTQYAFDVEVRDRIDPAFWASVVAEEGGRLEGDTLVWRASTTPILAELAPGQSVELHLVATVVDVIANGAYVENAASLHERGGTSFTTPPARLQVVSLPGLSASTKTVEDLGGGEVEPGDLLRYRLTVRNAGGEIARAVVLRDAPPAGTRYVPGSTTVEDLPVVDTENVSALVSGLPLGDLAPRTERRVSFAVRVLSDVLRGTVLSNQGFITARDLAEVGTDDPSTPGIIGDPTRVVVGGGPVLVAVLQAAPRLVEAGGVFTLVLGLDNGGSQDARQVRVELPLAEGASVVPGSLTLDGTPLSDAVDGDPGEVLPDRLVFTLPDMASYDSHRFTAQFGATGSVPVLRYQGVVSASNAGAATHTDGDQGTPGEQPTVVVVGEARADLSASQLGGTDLNGGLLEPGDEVRYLIMVANSGSAAAHLTSPQGLNQSLSPWTALIEGSIEGSLPLVFDTERQLLTLARGVDLQPGERLSATLRVRVLDEAVAGTAVESSAVVRGDELDPVPLGPHRLVVGGLQGTARLRGRVYEDIGGVVGRFDRNVDALMDGFQVQLRRPGSSATLGTQVADAEGQYLFAAVPAGGVELVVLSETGALFKTLGLPALAADGEVEQDLLIDPSGVIYDATTGAAVRGAQVFVYVEDDDFDPANDRLAGPDRVAPEQQGQLTNPDGLYRFDVRPGRYRMEIVPAGTAQVFPSILIPPTNDDDGEHPYGSFAITDEQHRVVPAARPDLRGDTHYYLRFDITGVADEVLHNHVPLDPLSSHVSLVKSANHRRLSMGDIVTYSVRYTNRSDLALSVASDGGVAVVDAIPKGFRYLKGSSRLERIEAAGDGSRRRRTLSSSDPAGHRLLVFGPHDLVAHGEYLLRYQLVVAPDAEVGDHENVAVLRTAGGQIDISNRSVARVQVVPDPVFDLGTVVGKVYCDVDGDGFQDPGEAPLGGAVVYVDDGRHAESDLGGKFHFSGLKPGNHLLKLDWRTLPPGSQLTTPERASLYVTRGLPSRLSFGVRCMLAELGPSSVTRAAAAPVEDAGPPPDDRVWITVSGVATQRRVVFDNAEQAVVRVDLGLGLGSDEREFGNVDGPNPSQIDPVSGLNPPLHFYPRVVTAMPVSGWRLALRTTAGDELYAFSGDGLPPEDISWDGRGSATGSVLLQRGGEYRAQLMVTALNGDWGASVPRSFGVGLGESAQLAEGSLTRLDEVDGALFDRRGKPTARLRKALEAVIRELKSQPSLRAVVEVHTDDKAGDRALSLTGAQAERVRELLVQKGVAAERIEIHGRADQQLLVPNMGKRNRARNRRVELRTLVPASRGAPVPHLEYEGQVVVNGVRVEEVEASSAFRHTLRVAVGDIVVVDLTAPSGGRVVLARTYTGEPFAEGPPAITGVQGVQVQGSVAARSLRFDDSERGMALLDLRMTPSNPATGLELGVVDGRLEEPLRLAVRVPQGAALSSWRLRVFRPASATTLHSTAAGGDGSGGDAPVVDVGIDGGRGAGSSLGEAVDAGPAWRSGAIRAFAVPDQGSESAPPDPVGVLVRELTGEGAPPELVEWAGTSDSGQLVLGPGWYGARIELESVDGDRAMSAPLWFKVRGAAVSDTATLKDPFPGERKRLSPRDQRVLRLLVATYRGQAVRYRVSAHTDDSVPRDQAADSTRQWADWVAAALAAEGVAADAIRVAGLGSSEPLVPNIGSRNRARNRRVMVQVMGEDMTAPPPVLPARRQPWIEVNGVALSAPQGSFTTTSYPTRDGVIRVRAVLADLGEATWLYRAPAPEVKAVVPLSVDAGSRSGEDAAALPAPALVAVPGLDDFTPFDPTVLGAPVLVTASAPDGGFPEDGGGGLPMVFVTAPGAVTDPTMAAAEDGGPGRVDAAGIKAAELRVAMPDGVLLRTARFALRGTTHPGNTVQVNGVEVAVDPDSGAFDALVELPEGLSVVKIEAHDGEGNSALVQKQYEVDTTGLFLLGLADTAVAGRGADLPEWSGTNHVKVGGVALYGRGAALLKAHWKGETLFKDYHLTLHLDTARWNEDAFAREYIDPELYYPVYGDSSTEVVDADARYPLYAELKADHSVLRVGNFRTAISGGDLFRYDRARYGMVLHFDEPLLEREGLPPWLDNDLTGYVAGGDAPRRHARVELRGTGGSLYYLAHDNVVEGSERVNILVRDAITGVELMRRPLARNLDYSIRYREGRVLLNLPLSSTVESGMLANQNLSTVVAGHPVALEIEYEHEAQGDFNQIGAGVYGEETVAGHVTVGGGYVFEGRTDERPAFQMAGANLKLAYNARTFVQGEWAWTRAVSMDNFISTDGGLSFDRLGQQPDDPSLLYGRVLFPAEREGHAFKLRGQTALAGLWGASPEDLALSAYFQRMAPGFSTGVSAIEAGQTKYGTEGRWLITSRDTLRLRYDGIWTEIPVVPQITEYRRLHRELASLQYQRRQDDFTITGEYAFAYSWDSGSFGQSAFDMEREVWGNTVAAGVEYDLTRRLVLVGRQEGILTGDPQQLPNWNDHLVTTVGLRYRLLDDLQLSALESVRWSGENATTVGVQTRIDDTTDVYARERFNMRGGSWVSTSVVGASSQVARGIKTFGEYQLDGTVAGSQTRAVMGLSTSWTLMKGLNLQLGYERTQVFGGSGTAPATGLVPAAAITDSYAFAAPGAAGAQAFYAGSGSRDAASAALDFTAHKALKAGLKLELRYDDLDQKRGGQDRLLLLAQGGLTWAWNRDLAVLGRFNLANVENLTLETSEAGLQDISLGVAYRPVDHEWISVLAKYGRRLEHRPLSLLEGSFEEYSADVATLEPILELPWHLQLTEKLALKYARERVDDLPTGEAWTLLWINRLNLHLMRMVRPWVDFFPGDVDVGAEWRTLWQLSTATSEQGLLFELTYAPYEFVRFGLGWNFTRFSDDEYARNTEDHSGFFFRVVGQY
ncbi:MAG: OmpA family protein [Pseudomonadota bacterium]